MTATARTRGTAGGSRLGRLLPVGTGGARRTPFVLLVVVLLGSGLIGLLLLNSALNQGSFELSRLQRKTTELTDRQQALQQEVDQLAAPDALERRARELGMVPGGSPAFLNPDGTVSGVPAPAPEAGAAPGDGGPDPAAYRPPAPAPVPAPVPSPVPAPGPPAAEPAPSPAPAAPSAPSAPSLPGLPGR
ncbi:MULTISPECIES: FtsB family cell division protein [Streptomyces]|uniref:FtsB family cell division protein n=1 Tax=Streptomyces TaxID=1883 RepID=UPI00163C4DBD|nr:MULTISPECIES: septum formation initiator family protein [Streptomyces]MBC2877062.1 septum formation initiator family protein [Streptomyces sp. TYQ1024]UBI39337.1 septum formation initiator family protein [Streptomyces mobaraensis]UKW31917.1 septum formation initiator family protein [Streptomyces sp. TYQ1024]